ncbi:MAG: UDP-N-acetylmuramate--L-alanine ligase [Patescibacteria group bacterium]|jgi:UDP-N-acetylmuramate--alanine ligase
MDFSKIKKIYMIGVKGVGMTMLGQFLAASARHSLGEGGRIKISGSDGPEKYMTDAVLAKAGIKVIEHFDALNIPRAADLIIYSTAYNAETNVEVAAAFAKASAAKAAVKVLTYAQALGEIFNQKYGIAVVGSHGKTTTTAWLGYVMKMAELLPNVMVGARVPQFDGCSLIGGSDYLVIEADEYQNKLANYQPKAVILNNIDYDHPDFFPTPEDYENVFIEFIKKIPGKGFLVANFDDPIIRKTAQVNCKGKVITYAINEAADYVAYDIKNNNGQQYFKVKLGVEAIDDDGDEISAEELGDFSIQLAGRHNILNALAVIATCVELNVELFKIRKYLEEFTGTARRMQVLGEFKGAVVVDDYAHHPTEIKATVEAVRQKYGDRNLIVVFHPHTFSRTKALFNDFAESFSGVDELIIIDIYGSARERQGGAHSRDLVEKIKSNNQLAGVKQAVKYISTLAECEKYLRGRIERGDVVALMGAGDIFRIGENLVKE